MKDHSNGNQADIIKAFNSTSRYLDDPYFEGMVNQIYPSELQLNKANTSDTEPPFWICISLFQTTLFPPKNMINVMTDFDIVNFVFIFRWRCLTSSFLRSIYLSARVCSHVGDFNTRNECLTIKLLKQSYRYHNLRKAFSKLYRRQNKLVSKFNIGLKSLLHQGLSEPEFYGDLVYKFKKIRGMTDFSDQFRKILILYKRIGYNLNVMRQSHA